MTNKTIIPTLVTVSTAFEQLPGGYYTKNMNFFEPQADPARFAFSVHNAPASQRQPYDFRSEYTTQTRGKWVYERPAPFGLSFRMQFDPQSLTFGSSTALRKLPFVIGGIRPAGDTFSNLINFYLFTEGFVQLRGCAFRKDGQVFAISAPGMNGKSTFLTQMLSEGAEYIAEDNLVISLQDKMVYPTAPTPMPRLWGRRANSTVSHAASSSDRLTEPVRIDRLLLVENTLTAASRKRTLLDYVWLNAMYFWENLFIRSIAFGENLHLKIFDTLESVRHFRDYEYRTIQNFNFREALNG